MVGSENADREQGPNEERPVKETSVSASATAHTRPVVGRDRPQRTGTVIARTRVVVECSCGGEVTVYSGQPVICQNGTKENPCGRQWRME